MFTGSNTIDIKVIAHDIASETLKDINSSVGTLGKGTEKTGESMTSSFFKATLAVEALKASLGLILKAVEFLWGVLKSGAELDMLNTSLMVVAKNAGISAKEIEGFKNELAKTNTFGSQATETMKSIISSGLLPMIKNFKSASGNEGFAGFIEVIKDYSAQLDGDTARAIDNFNTFLKTGRSEVVESYGVVENLTKVYAQYAKSIGKDASKLTALEQTQARLNFLQKDGAKYAGSYFAVYETAGKNLSSIPNVFESIKEELGSALQDPLKVVTNLVLELMKGFRMLIIEAGPKIKEFGEKVKGVIQNIIGYFKELLQNPVIQKLVVGMKATFDKIAGIVKDFFDGSLQKKFDQFVSDNKDSPIIKYFQLLKRIVEEAFPKIKEWIVNAITSIQGSFERIRPSLENIFDKFKKLAELIYNIVGPVIQFLLDQVIKPFFDWLSVNAGPILEVFFGIVSSIFTAIYDVVKWVFDAIGSIITKAVEIWNGYIKPSLEFLYNIFKKAFETIRDVISTVFNFIKDRIVTPVMTWFAENIAPKLKPITDAVTKIFTQMRIGVELAFNGLSLVIKTVINVIIDAVNGMIESLNKGIDALNSFDKAMGGKGEMKSIGTVGRLDTSEEIKKANNLAKELSGLAGGTSFWKGGPVIVGEKGPELVNLPKGSSVTSNSNLSGAGMNQSININISGYDQNPEELAQKIQTILAKQNRLTNLGYGYNL